MVSKNQIKLITGLQQKKYRKQYKLFIVEGVKVVRELLNSYFTLRELYTTQDLFEGEVADIKTTLITEAELRKISALTTPNTCLAIFEIPEPKQPFKKGLIVALDDVRDPGNMGTIIRLCDWFGIKQLLCSEQSVDIYNPKVVQATMGSISRVNITYTNLADYIEKTKLPVFGTFMNGDTIYRQQLPTEGIIVMGNEANGISDDISKIISHRITIPRYGTNQETESLNVATATAIILSEFCRNF